MQVYSVSSKEFEPRLKLKYPKDKYVTFGTDEFNELLAAAADFADSQRCPQEEEEECTQESFAQLADDPSPNDSTSDSENQGRNGTGSQDNAHRPDNVPKSDSTEQYDSVRVNDSEAVNSQNLPQPPLTPEQPVRVKAAIQSPTPSRLATQLHDRPQLDFKPDLKRLRQTRDASKWPCLCMLNHVW